MTERERFAAYEENTIQDAKRQAATFAQIWEDPQLLRSSAISWSGNANRNGSRHQRLWYFISEAYYAAAAEREAGLDPCR